MNGHRKNKFVSSSTQERYIMFPINDKELNKFGYISVLVDRVSNNFD